MLAKVITGLRNSEKLCRCFRPSWRVGVASSGAGVVMRRNVLTYVDDSILDHIYGRKSVKVCEHDRTNAIALRQCCVEKSN